MLRAGCCFQVRSTWRPTILPQTAWKPLNRSAKYQVKTKPRARRERRQAADRGTLSSLRRHSAGRCSGLPSSRIALSPARSTPTASSSSRKNSAGERTATAAIYSMTIVTSCTSPTIGTSTPEEIVFDANDPLPTGECAGRSMSRSGLACAARQSVSATTPIC